jgi:hypothetical protein
MAGEFDVIRRDHTDQLATSIANSHEIIVHGAHHSLPIERPETVNALVGIYIPTSTAGLEF